MKMVLLVVQFPELTYIYSILSVTPDSGLTTNKHVTDIVTCCICHLRAVWHIGCKPNLWPSSGMGKWRTEGISCSPRPGMEITGIASQFAMQSRRICDASSHMRRNSCGALLDYTVVQLCFIPAAVQNINVL